MKDIFASLEAVNLRGSLQKEAQLSDYSSWRTGGRADYLYLPADLSDLECFLQSLQVQVPLTWLGLGSNTLVRDNGVEGVVVVTQGALTSLSSLEMGDEIRAEAGVAAAQLARFSARIGLTGLEFMAGIPGTVGGALAMNAGCFGGETWQYVKRVETMNRQGEIKLRSADEFQVAYRSVKRPADEWFVAGHFALTAGNKQQSLDTIRHLLEKRNHSQPTGTANCGSVFRNPEGTFAGRLIEECGLKGLAIGGAKVSEKHANFIINHDAASAHDIEKLIAQVSAIVHEKTGIRLIPEVCIMGRQESR